MLRNEHNTYVGVCFIRPYFSIRIMTIKRQSVSRQQICIIGTKMLTKTLREREENSWNTHCAPYSLYGALCVFTIDAVYKNCAWSATGGSMNTSHERALSLWSIQNTHAQAKINFIICLNWNTYKKCYTSTFRHFTFTNQLYLHAKKWCKDRVVWVGFSNFWWFLPLAWSLIASSPLLAIVNDFLHSLQYASCLSPSTESNHG